MPFITPDNLPVDTFCRQIFIPNSPKWIGAVSGALLPYIYASAWEKIDGIEPEEAANRWHQMLNEYWLSTCGGDMTECCEPALKQYRVNPDTGLLEQSLDGGETWQEVPNSIYSGAVEPAPLSGEDGDNKKCEASNNVVDMLKDVKTGIASKLELSYSLYDFIIAILVEIVALVLAGLTGGTAIALVLPLIPKIIEVARGIFGLTVADYNAMFTEEVWTTTRCIMYCHIGDNGKFDAAGWSAVKADLIDQLGAGATQAGANIASMVDVWSLKGLNHAAAIGAGTSGNCDDCPCGCTNKDLFAIFNNAGTDWGTLVSEDDVSITVAAVNTLGDYKAALVSADYTQGCIVDGVLISGAIDGTTCWINEGDNPASVSPTCSIYGAHNVIYLQFESTTAFTVKFTFS